MSNRQLENAKTCYHCRPLVEENEKLRAALRLAKDMFIANGLILPKTFEVIDEVLPPCPGGGEYFRGED